MTDGHLPAGVVFQVDSGNLFSAFQDSSGLLWQADFNFLGGNTEGTGHAISNTSQADGDAPMYATNRVGPAFLYDFGPINRLMPNASYSVTLFFTEIYWDGPGLRLFNISANNQTVVTDWDIFATAGGRDAACNVTFMVTLGPLAQLQLQFEGVRDQASVAGIQVSGPRAPSFQIPSFLQDDSDTDSAASIFGTPILRIDTGRSFKLGNYSAGNSDVWTYDRLYQGGGTESFNTVIRNATDIGSTIYDTNRIGGSFQYGFTPAQGIKAGERYTVVLHAADLYWSYPGERVFSVSANGVPVLTDYDVIAEAGGPFAAAVASFNVTADKKGSIALTWTASTDQAIVGGLELYHSKRQSSRDPADVFASVVPPAAEPSYSPLDFSASNLQAAAPGPLLSAGALAPGPAGAPHPAYGFAYGYGNARGGYGYSPKAPSYGGYGSSAGRYGY
ncbi:g5516 [Coccomyxa viridis]|uniref:G5516 protein n=1 Tax=Coccomyxa viridis TaxID=1274662 RepID=A0ABP1FT15_9CHLO